ncbi:MAG: hypothetical protein LBR64_02775 [Dysgonamonadaceae bacterium]|jgi:hypothetical protein|nr:hypothetical protein [Dysgonamonadaceae bacterium]
MGEKAINILKAGIMLFLVTLAVNIASAQIYVTEGYEINIAEGTLFHIEGKVYSYSSSEPVFHKTKKYLRPHKAEENAGIRIISIASEEAAPAKAAPELAAIPYNNRENIGKMSGGSSCTVTNNTYKAPAAVKSSEFIFDAPLVKLISHSSSNSVLISYYMRQTRRPPPYAC